DINNYEGFKLVLIRIFSIDTQITEQEFANSNIDKLVNKVFQEASEYYGRKSEAIAQQALPVLREILNTKGNNIENIIIPFTDGSRGIQISAPLQKSVETNGREVIKSFEKNIVLALIDDTWKEHLREMDDLKQSVQNAVYEQKDPLIIYKMEAFNLFK